MTLKKDLTYNTVVIFTLVLVLIIPLHEFGHAFIRILEGKTFYFGFDPATFTFFVTGSPSSYLCSFFGGFFAGTIVLLLFTKEPILISISLSQFVYSIIELSARHISFLTGVSLPDIMMSNYILIDITILTFSLIALIRSIQIYYHPPDRVRTLIARVHDLLYDAKIKAEVRRKLASGEYRTSPEKTRD